MPVTLIELVFSLLCRQDFVLDYKHMGACAFHHFLFHIFSGNCLSDTVGLPEHLVDLVCKMETKAHNNDL
jgi:hypothetical protein